MEVTTVLALVGSRRLGDGVSVDGALDVGRWERVLGASDGRVCGRVTLEEDVEESCRSGSQSVQWNRFDH